VSVEVVARPPRAAVVSGGGGALFFPHFTQVSAKNKERRYP